MASNFIPLCLIGVLLTANVANCLQCYACNSKESTMCRWGLTSFTFSTEECKSGGLVDTFITPKCYKITAEDKEGGSYIARGCSPPGTIGVACSALAKTIGWISSESNSDLQHLACETCETDKCNSATKITAISIGAVVVSAIVFLL